MQYTFFPQPMQTKIIQFQSLLYVLQENETTCADPESFFRGGPTVFLYFFS